MHGFLVFWVSSTFQGSTWRAGSYFREREDKKMKARLCVGRSLVERRFVFGKFIGGMYLEVRLIGIRVYLEVKHPSIRPW